MSWLANRAACRVMKPSLAQRAYSQGVLKTIRAGPTWAQYAGGAASLALGGLCAYGLSQPADYVPANSRNLMRQFGGKAYAERVRWRVGQTYAYLAAGLVMTAGVATFAFQRGLAMRMAQMNPMALCFGGLAASIGCMMGTRMTPYDNPMKHVWWSGFNAVTGLTLVPIGMLGGALVTQAAMITGCILGSLSAVAACSPDDTFLKMGPILGCGLGVIVAASLGSMFFPTSGLLMNVSLYGGLGVFGLFICYDTQKILYHAQMDNHYDPINREIGIYLHTINIFVRVAQILAMSGGRRK